MTAACVAAGKETGYSVLILAVILFTPANIFYKCEFSPKNLPKRHIISIMTKIIIMNNMV